MNRVISTEKLPIKLWLNYLEDGAELQVKNLANLPFAFKHIAVMPDSHEGYGMPIGGVLATKGVIIPNAVGVDIGCFVGNTEVRLLDGTVDTLENLTKRKDPFYVYSLNKEGNICAGLATAMMTRKDAGLMNIYLDIKGTEPITCTPDHKFMLRNGTYKEAKDLKEGDSLMPLYLDFTSDKDGYTKVYNPRTKSYQKTHWAIARGGSLGEIPSYENQKTIIHHSDFNKQNNDPSNLKFMGNKDHSKFHRSIAERNSYWQSADFEEKRIAGIRKKIKEDKEFLTKKQEIGKNNIVKYMKEKRSEFLFKVAENGKRGKPFLTAYNTSTKGKIKSKELANKYYPCELCGKKIKSYIGLYNHKRKEHNNHKVAFVETIQETKPVYCLYVDKYHNFALNAGVFVHNCGMCAVQTSLTEIDTETLKKIMGEIRKVIPVGFNHQSKRQDKLLMPDKKYPMKVVDEQYESALSQIGTLGGGNHFIEIQKGSDGHIWIMIHSGSRNIGLKVANYYNKLAIELNEKWHSAVPKSWDLAFLPLDIDEGQNYLDEMQYCVEFAFANRKLMMDRIFELFNKETGALANDFINIAHNYASLENHFGENVWIHRKGATLARKDTIGIIPGSQGTKSYIVKGLGNPESFMSCSHGAGRKMGRNQAKNNLNLEEEQKKMEGVIHGIRSIGDLDEAPGAYKPIEEVMDNQKDLIEISVELTPLGVIKG
jgi:tRNA-splicing ligase RtcB